MKKYIVSIFLLFACLCSAQAQGGRIVSDLELLNVNNKAATLPYFGQRNLLIFYVDPDRIGQNDALIQELKENKKLNDKELAGMTILCTKDAPNIPERLLYKIAKKREETSGTPFFIDNNHILASAWRLGNCDNQSTIIIVSKKGELLFLNKGKINDTDKLRFYRVLDGL